MSNLNNNTTQLELLLAKVNELPEAGSGGVDTSDATATADEIFAGETAYTANGKVTGTFTIENELTEQNDLISQIATLVATKATPSVTNTEDVTEETNAYTTKLASLETAITALENELEGKASGGSGGASVETCTVYFFSGAERSHNAYGVYYENGEFSSYSMPIPDMSNINVEVIKNSFIVISSTFVTAIDMGSSDLTPILIDKTTISGASIIAVENYESIRINIMD